MNFGNWHFAVEIKLERTKAARIGKFKHSLSASMFFANVYLSRYLKIASIKSDRTARLGDLLKRFPLKFICFSE